MPQKAARRRPCQATVPRSNKSSTITLQPASVTRLPSCAPDSAAWSPADLPERIASNITVDEATGCWLVGAGNDISIDKDGYARYRGEGVHRIVYKTLVGEIPADRPVIDHVKARGCTWRNCCRPDHLEAVTVRTNTMRGSSFSAVNAAKDECDHGHPFDLLNCYWRPDGHRDCRICTARRQREYQQRKRQQAAATKLPSGAELGRAA